MSDYIKKSSPQLLLTFIKNYPWKFLTALLALLTAGIVETIGIGALLPLLNIVLDTSGVQDSNIVMQTINNGFNFLGIEPNFQNLLFIIVLTISLKALIIFQALKIVSYISIDITYDLRQKFIRSLIHARWQYFSTLNVGKSANAIATEADYAGQFCMIMGKTITAAFQAGIYIFIAFMIDWKISLAAIVIGAFAAFILKFLVRMARDAGSEMTKSLNALLSRLNEALSGAKPIKAMGKEAQYIELLHKDTMDLQKSRKKLDLSSLLLNLIHEPLLVLLMATGLLWAYNYAQYPISELFMMAFLFNRLLSQVNMVQNYYQKSSMFEAAVNSIFEKIHVAQNHKESLHGTIDPSFKQSIKFENISLAYDKDTILQNFDDHIPAHKMTIIFGASGSGKSSLLDATLGLLPPQNGHIYIDDTALDKIDIQKWRDQIGYVPQETFLFHDTVLSNVTLGNKDISEDQVIMTLKAANAWEFVESLPDKLNHIVGERGGKLSGGQKQRIAIARALVRKPSLLVLDEATSGLDKNNEEEILKTLKNISSEITIVLISHNPEILNLADHVIELDKTIAEAV